MKKTLTHKLNAVLSNINQENIREALGQLRNDILKKTDGCASLGMPDRNDWLIDCPGQNRIYPQILKALNFLQSI